MLYHHAPLYATAQLPVTYASLSWSRVVKLCPRCHAKESPSDNKQPFTRDGTGKEPSFVGFGSVRVLGTVRFVLVRITARTLYTIEKKQRFAAWEKTLNKLLVRCASVYSRTISYSKIKNR